MTRVHQLLARAVASKPAGVAVIHGSERWSYARLGSQAVRAAARLADLGVTSGDRVLVAVSDSAHLVALLYACSLTGAALIPVPPDATSFQLSAYRADARPAVTIVAPGRAIPPVPVKPDLGIVVPLGTVCNGDEPATGRRPALCIAEERPSVAFLLYTSGSSAKPRAVICPHDAVLFAARAIGSRLGYCEDDVVYSRIPMSFDYGLYQVLLCAQAMCTLVLDGETPALRLLPAMREVAATVVPVVPPLAATLGVLAARTRRTPPVRLFTNTGADLSPGGRAALRAGFPGAKLALMYGLTECKRATIMAPDGDLVRPQSVGTPLEGTTIKVLAGGRLTTEPGVLGEVVVEGPHVMAGYWRAPALTRKRFPRLAGGPGRLRTGDLGFLDGDGYLYLRGRLDDTFKRNGIRMSCQEVEAAALDIPGVRAAAAMPPESGLDLALFAVSDLRRDEITQLLADRLPPARRPAACHIVTALPVTPRGKVDRQVLRAIIARGTVAPRA